MIAARKVHPLVAAAAAGRLPDWAVAGPERRAHMARVAALLDAWAETLRLDEADRVRWRAAGWLHDALRDERPEVLRPLVPERFRSLAGKALHGPAAAERLRDEGVASADLLEAVAYHTLGDAGLGILGRAVYAADFLEPGREFLPEWRAELRARMPAEGDAVLREIVRARIANLLERGMAVRPETLGLWNALTAGGAPASGDAPAPEGAPGPEDAPGPEGALPPAADGSGPASRTGTDRGSE